MQALVFGAAAFRGCFFFRSFRNCFSNHAVFLLWFWQYPLSHLRPKVSLLNALSRLIFPERHKDRLPENSSCRRPARKLHSHILTPALTR